MTAPVVRRPREDPPHRAAGTLAAWPELARVLPVIARGDESWWRAMITSPNKRGGLSWDPEGVSICVRPDWRYNGVTHLRRWRITATAEVIEALHSRDLWPWDLSDPAAPRWATRVCYECGFVEPLALPVTCPTCSSAERVDRVADAPPSVRAFVSVAALGPRSLTAAASCADVIARVAGHKRTRVAWRVMTRAAIDAHHLSRWCALWGDRALLKHPPSLFSVEAHEVSANREHTAWQVTCPWELALAKAAPLRDALTLGRLRDPLVALALLSIEAQWKRRAPGASVADMVWGALRALAVTEDGRPTGVHLVDLDADTVTLAVESL